MTSPDQVGGIVAVWSRRFRKHLLCRIDRMHKLDKIIRRCWWSRRFCSQIVALQFFSGSTIPIKNMYGRQSILTTQNADVAQTNMSIAYLSFMKLFTTKNNFALHVHHKYIRASPNRVLPRKVANWCATTNIRKPQITANSITANYSKLLDLQLPQITTHYRKWPLSIVNYR